MYKKRIKRSSKVGFHHDINKIVESQIRKVMEQYLSKINKEPNQYVKGDVISSNAVEQTFAETFNYSANQIASRFIKNIVRKF